MVVDIPNPCGLLATYHEGYKMNPIRSIGTGSGHMFSTGCSRFKQIVPVHRNISPNDMSTR